MQTSRGKVLSAVGRLAIVWVTLFALGIGSTFPTSAAGLEQHSDGAPVLPFPAPEAYLPKQTAAPLQDAILQAASAFNIPESFFVQLIWQESRFNPNAISPVGAQGIAQFMPDTARWRGLADPYEPKVALQESARWLHELWSEFGNLGLAAAAYNAGPARVKRWLADRRFLPSDTRAYVRIVTGYEIEIWAGCVSKEDRTPASKNNCPEAFPPPPSAKPLGGQKIARAEASDRGEWGPWGLQLIGDWSEARALSDYRKLQLRFPDVLGERKALVLRGSMAGRGSATWYRIRVAETTRARADQLCARLERAGGKCIVFHN